MSPTEEQARPGPVRAGWRHVGGAEVETPGPQGKGTRIILSRNTQPPICGPGLTSNHCQIARRRWLRWAFASPVSGRHEFAGPVLGTPLAKKKPSPGGSLGEGLSSFDYYYFYFTYLPIAFTYFTTMIVMAALCPLPPVAVAATTDG